MQLLVIVITIFSYTSSSTSLNYYYHQQQEQQQQQQLNTEVELVQLIFRNGERRPRPDESYPLDRYASVVPYDARLTDLGRYRARCLGLVLRRSYFELLRDGLYAYSSSLDSCKESLQEMIQTLCARGECGGVRRSVVPREIDVVLNGKACSRYQIEMEKVRRSTDVQRMLAKYDGLYRYIAEKTGLSLGVASTTDRLHHLHSLLESQRSMNLSLPDWCPDGVYSLLSEMSFMHYNLDSQNDNLRQFNGGPLIRRFLDAATSPRTRARIHLYSGEGRNVAALGRALGKRFPRVPNYGSAIILEVRREVGDDADRVFVRTIVWTGVSEKMFPIQLRGCPELCPLEEFVKIVADVVPSDAEMRCLLDDVGRKDRVAF